MNLSEVATWVALIGAVIAALTGCVNLAILWRRRRVDRFRVRMGGIYPRDTRETMFHVVSYSDHAVELTDWGFITVDGRFFSFFLPEPGDESEVVGSGTSLLERFGSSFERGFITDGKVLGAYARSLGQPVPQLAFAIGTSVYQRTKIRIRLLISPNYFRW